MGRRSGRRGNKPPHIDVLELNRPKPSQDESAEVVLDFTPKKRKFQVHQTTSQVLSRDIDEKGQLELTVSDAININIFMRK